MNIILVDTSVWVNFFKGYTTPATEYLKSIISNTLIAVCPTIVQELLQGVVLDNDFLKTQNLFNELLQLKEDQYQLGIEAAMLYRKLRKEGITIRKPNDCLIAAYAIKNKVTLLHNDKDFEFIASKSELETIKFP